MSIKNNTSSLQSLLDKANSLPDTGSNVELPILTNEGSASDLLEGKQLIDGNGNITTGTFTIDSELSTQDSLIEQIQNAVDNLPDANTVGGEINLQTKTVTPNASSQIITPDADYDGLSQVIVNGDSNLIANNIKSGVNIFGVIGAYVGSDGGNQTSGVCQSLTINLEGVYLEDIVCSRNNQYISFGESTLVQNIDIG